MAQTCISLICPVCSKPFDKPIAYYNQSVKRNAPHYCSKVCAGLGRRNNKSPEQLKLEKAEYDRLYREKNAERLKSEKQEYFKKDYAANPEKYREQRQNRMPYHIEYCRQPKARAKEREARYRRNGQNKTKSCLCCKKDKRIIDFSCYLVFPDNRNYLCKECESTQDKELCITTREVLQCIRTSLHKHQSTLTIRDYTMYPYLIEAHKYSLLLKRLTR